MNKEEKRKTFFLFVVALLIIWNDFLPQILFRISIIGVTLIVFLLYGKRTKITVNESLKWYFFFFVVMVIEAVRGVIMSNVITGLLPALLALFVVAQIKPDEADVKRMIHFIALLGLFLCVYILVRYRSLLGYSRLGNNGRLEGTTITNSIGLSYYLISIICAQIWCAFVEEEFKTRLFYLVSIVPTGILILFSGVRKAIILALLFMIVLWLWSARKNQKRGLKIFLVFVFTVGAAYYAILTVPSLYNILGTRMGALLNRSMAGEDYSLISRSQLAITAAKGFLDNPILGKGVHGARNYLLTAPGLLHNTTHPHNNYLNLLLIGGIPLFLVYYVAPLVNGIRLLKTKPEMESASFYLLAYFVVILVSDFGTSSYNISLFTFFIGLMIYLSSKVQVIKQVNRGELDELVLEAGR